MKALPSCVYPVTGRQVGLAVEASYKVSGTDHFAGGRMPNALIKDHKPLFLPNSDCELSPDRGRSYSSLRSEILITFVQSKQPKDMTPRDWSASKRPYKGTVAQGKELLPAPACKAACWTPQLPISVPQAP